MGVFVCTYVCVESVYSEEHCVQMSAQRPARACLRSAAAAAFDATASNMNLLLAPVRLQGGLHGPAQTGRCRPASGTRVGSRGETGAHVGLQGAVEVQQQKAFKMKYRSNNSLKTKSAHQTHPELVNQAASKSLSGPGLKCNEHTLPHQLVTLLVD